MKKRILYINPVRDDDPQEMAILTQVVDAQTQLEYLLHCQRVRGGCLL